jgi:hypothetical protein
MVVEGTFSRVVSLNFLRTGCSPASLSSETEDVSCESLPPESMKEADGVRNAAIFMTRNIVELDGKVWCSTV